jgi:hypothetical protein
MKEERETEELRRAREVYFRKERYQKEVEERKRNMS